jgi:single-stranded-DNA-specific exonuclease
MTKVVTRHVDAQAEARLISSGMTPLLARIYAARGVASPGQLDHRLERLHPPAGLANAERAAGVLADAIEQGKKLLVIADYDCDGATACAVAIRGLKAFGAVVQYLVPNRFETGYGLTPEIVDIAQARFAPDLIITVDNGIASIAGAERAALLGIELVITDHHLPAPTLPKAAAIVNPNQPDCSFQSKNLAGVGVMFYVLLALRAEMRRRGRFDQASQPRLDVLLDLVALGTVADVVALDGNNRLLVASGMKRIREQRISPGIRALFIAAGRETRAARTSDLGFAIAPRINAAGRLADMSLGIACLVTDDEDEATQLAARLSSINQERRQIEADMQRQAGEALRQFDDAARLCEQSAICVFHPDWHQGVVGILAGRLKERFHRPTIAFAPIEGKRWRGSGRSIEGVHLRDVLDLLTKRHPDMVLQFGGHAMAAGLTIEDSRLTQFAPAFERAVAHFVDPRAIERIVETDGSLADVRLSVALVGQLEDGIWGQGFTAPLFCDEFVVLSQKVLKDKHTRLSLKLVPGQTQYEAIWFDQVGALPERVRLVYRAVTDSFNGQSKVQLVIQQQVQDG